MNDRGFCIGQIQEWFLEGHPHLLEFELGLVHIRDGFFINMFGIHAAHHFFRRATYDDFTMIHKDEFLRIGERGLEMVLCYDDCEAFLLIQLADPFIEFTDAFRIKGRCRFIEDQDIRLFSKDGCDDEALALAAGERRHLAFLKAFEVDFRERFF